MIDQDEYAGDVRGWLDSVDVPLSRLDTDQILQAGRFQVRRRRQLAIGGTAAVALATMAAFPAAAQVWQGRAGGPPAAVGESPVPAEPLATLECTVTELPLPDEASGEVESGPDPEVHVQAIDPTGRYVIGNGPTTPTLVQDSSELMPRYTPDGAPALAIRWDNGQPVVIPALRQAAFPKDVNADGVVVGSGWDESTGRAWIYRDGGVTELAVPTGYVSTSASAINAGGDVVGEAWGSGGAHAVVVWQAANPDQPHLLDIPAGERASLVDITDAGLVAGDVGSYVGLNGVEPTARAYLWGADGVGRTLPVPEGARTAHVSSVRGDWAVGTAWLADPTAGDGVRAVPVRWDLPAGTVEVLDLGHPSLNSAAAVNPAGEVLIAGSAVIREGEPYALPDPVDEGVIVPPGPIEDPLVETMATSDDGSMIAGNYILLAPDGSLVGIHPVLWRC